MTNVPILDDLHAKFLDQVNQAVDRLTFGVAAAPRTGEAHKHQPRYRRIVVAYDGSEGAQRALDWTKDIARAHGSTVTVVSSFRPPQVATAGAMAYGWYADYAEAYGAAERRARSAAEKGAQLLQALHVEATPIVVEGNAGHHAAKIATDQHADLVVVGATRGGRIHRALLGSTAATLLHRAPCSVLIARGGPRPARIMVATDGSRVGYRAVAHALHRASQTSAELTVLHVLDYPTETIDEVPPEGFLKAVAQHLELPAAPPKVSYRLDVGHPATRILMRAAEEDAGLIVLGSHGKEVIDRILVGSTSRRVANESQASVLVVKDA